MLLADNQFRDHYHAYLSWLHQTDEKSIERKREEADLLFRRVGITFNVYGDGDGAERLIPFDSIPRIIPAREWRIWTRGSASASPPSMPFCTTSITISAS
jgi:uncharacterized circularly permuted ATP-grasp superfamily protein